MFVVVSREYINKKTLIEVIFVTQCEVVAKAILNDIYYHENKENYSLVNVGNPENEAELLNYLREYYPGAVVIISESVTEESKSYVDIYVDYLNRNLTILTASTNYPDLSIHNVTLLHETVRHEDYEEYITFLQDSLMEYDTLNLSKDEMVNVLNCIKEK